MVEECYRSEQQEQGNAQPPQSEIRGPGVRLYATPVLTQYGSLGTLTQGNLGNIADAAGATTISKSDT